MVVVPVCLGLSPPDGGIIKAMDDESKHPLMALAARAGIHTKAELARRTGVRPDAISRALSDASDRTLPLPHIDAIAQACGVDLVVVARTVLPAHDPDLKLCERVYGEVIGLRNDLATERMGATERGAMLEAVQAQARDRTQELGARHDEVVQLRGDLQQARAHRDHVQAERVTERRRVADLEAQRRRDLSSLDEAERRLVAVKDEASKEIGRLTEQIGELRDEVGQERVTALRNQALTGAFGVGVGVWLGRATSSPTRDGEASTAENPTEKDEP
jgi:hypothetical protein